MSWTPIPENDFPWLPIPEEGIPRDVDPQLYGLPVDYHELPEHLRALARSQRSGPVPAASEHEVPDNLPAPAASQQGLLAHFSSTCEVAASVSANAPAVGQLQQSVVAPATLDREVPANTPGSSPSQQSATGPGTHDGERSDTLHQSGVSPAVGGDGDLEAECRRNPNMQLFLQRHPSLAMQNKAVRRDMVARRTLGALYHEHNQGAYNVIEKRANMTQDLNARSQELDGGIRQVLPPGNENGKKKPMHYCRSCEEWFYDWRCRHVHHHMQDPEDENDKLLICPVNLLGLRSRSRTLSSLEDIVSVHMQNHPHS